MVPNLNGNFFEIILRKRSNYDPIEFKYLVLEALLPIRTDHIVWPTTESH